MLVCTGILLLMRTVAITFVAPPHLSGAAARHASQLLEHWPRSGESPRCRIITREELIPDLENVWICLIDDSADRKDIEHLAGLFTDTHAAALLISANADDLCRTLPDAEVLIESSAVSAPTLASIVCTLAQRQATIRHMALDLKLATATTRTLAREIDQFQQEMELAAAVQREFIPREAPRIPGLEIAMAFRPCAYVSGDIFDLVPQSDGTLAFFLADAVGHGVPAALLTMAITRAMTASSRAGHTDPSHVLARLNDELIRHPGHAHKYATAICGIIDPARRSVTLAGAGHPYPLRLQRSADAIMIAETPGPMLGVFEDADFPSITFDLLPGQTLLVHSDGLEAAAEPLKLGISDLARTHLTDENDSDLDSAVQQLEQHLHQGDGSLHQPDDVTMIAIRAVPLAGDLRIAA